MRVIVAGGGTGGHLYPGIAVAEELALRGGHQVSFVGTARGIEARAVPKAGFALDLLDVAGLKGGGPLGVLRGLLRLPRALLQAIAILRRRRPGLVVGVGGYASGPLVATAWLFRIPTAILEQNSVPGITNRILGRLVGAVFAAFEESRGFFPAGKVELLGNPIRQSVRAALAAASDRASDGDVAVQQKRVLVLGGSQGARGLNALCASAFERLAATGRAPRLVHQTGPADREAIAARYARAGIDAEVTAFIDDMAAAYAAADLVVARAGATTLAEVTAIGRAALLVPFPAAADDHQTRNAEALVHAGAARLFPERSTDPAALAEAVAAVLDDDEARARMAEAARALGRPEAAARIVDRLLALGRG